MSIAAINAVWGADLSGQDRMLLLAMADYANEDGHNIFPSIERLVWKTGFSKRSIQRWLVELRKRGILVVAQKSGRSRPTTYSLIFEALPPKPAFGAPGKASRAMKEELIQRFERTCHVCDRAGGEKKDPDDRPWQVGKLTAGGGYEWGNVVLLCEACEGVPDRRGGGDGEAPYLSELSGSSSLRSEEQEQHSRKDPVTRIFEHFVKRANPPTKELTVSRRSLIERALRESSFDLCIAAIDGLVRWQRVRGGELLLGRIFQTRPGGSPLTEQIEFFAAQAESGNGRQALTSEGRLKMERLKDELRKRPGNEQARAELWEKYGVSTQVAYDQQFGRTVVTFEQSR